MQWNYRNISLTKTFWIKRFRFEFEMELNFSTTTLGACWLILCRKTHFFLVIFIFICKWWFRVWLTCFRSYSEPFPSNPRFIFTHISLTVTQITCFPVYDIWTWDIGVCLSEFKFRGKISWTANVDGIKNERSYAILSV